MPKPTKTSRGLCATKYCRNPRNIDRGLKCNTCYSRLQRARHPERSCWWSLRSHAKARGIACTISFTAFTAFLEGTDYMSRKGVQKRCLHVDRKDPRKGYEDGNLRLLTCSENSTTYNTMYRLSKEVGWDRAVETVLGENEPF